MNRKGLTPIELLLIIMVVGVLVLGGIYLYYTYAKPGANTYGQSPSYTPSTNGTSTGVGLHCGGFIANAPTCPSGFYCVLGNNPDTGGTCEPNQ